MNMHPNFNFRIIIGENDYDLSSIDYFDDGECDDAFYESHVNPILSLIKDNFGIDASYEYVSTIDCVEINIRFTCVDGLEYKDTVEFSTLNLNEISKIVDNIKSQSTIPFLVSIEF